MRHSLNKYSMLTLVAAALILTGCIVSGTFVVSKMYHDIDFSTDNGFYYELIDITSEEEWKDHEEDIESIDVVGFEMWITNLTGQSATFDVWVDDATNPADTLLADVEANATKVISGLTVAAPKDFVSYGKSLSVVTNTKTLKDYVRTGRFHYYGNSSAGTEGTDFVIDSVKVILTLSASDK